MVYESDYYTSRRPYSRPSVSSYTVTTLNHTATPGLGKAQTFHRTIPFVAHKRLTTNNAPPHSNRVRPSTMFAEMSRIQRRVRPAIGSKPVEDFLNTHAVTAFDDETHLIRAQTNALLKKIHAPIPRTQKPLFSPNRYDEIQAVPITSDSYIQRMLGPVRNVQQDILSMSHYNEPAKGYIGKGHLACVTFAGGRPISRRRNRVLAEDDRVKDDVKFLSYYDKTRTAANGPYYQPRADEFYGWEAYTFQRPETKLMWWKALPGEFTHTPAGCSVLPRPTARSQNLPHVGHSTTDKVSTAASTRLPPLSTEKAPASTRSKSQSSVEPLPSLARQSSRPDNVTRQQSLREEPEPVARKTSQTESPKSLSRQTSQREEASKPGSRKTSQTGEPVKSLSRQTSQRDEAPKSLSRQTSQREEAPTSISRQTSQRDEAPKSLSRQTSRKDEPEVRPVSLSRQQSQKDEPVLERQKSVKDEAPAAVSEEATAKALKKKKKREDAEAKIAAQLAREAELAELAELARQEEELARLEAELQVPEPAVEEPAPEPVIEAGVEPSEPEYAVPEPEPVAPEPESEQPEPELAPEPESVLEPVPTEPEPVPEPVTEEAVEPEPVVEPEAIVEPEPVVEPDEAIESTPALEPEPVVEPAIEQEEPVIEEPLSPPIDEETAAELSSGPAIEEVEIPLEGESAEGVVQRAQEVVDDEELPALG